MKKQLRISMMQVQQHSTMWYSITYNQGTHTFRAFGWEMVKEIAFLQHAHWNRVGKEGLSKDY